MTKLHLSGFLGIALLAAIGSILVTFQRSEAAEPPFNLPAADQLRRVKSATIYTNRGRLSFELYPEDAPWHVANFKYLADKGFYKGLSFHIFYPGYIIQGGAPRDGKSGPGYTLPAEFNRHVHKRGSLGMARRPDQVNPGRRSNGSQFHILLEEAPNMNGSYTIFGQLIDGSDALDQLTKGDIIEDVKVFVERK
jgi:peptidyl-prolyl cis-trans isomerase B (cyclophilin B)